MPTEKTRTTHVWRAKNPDHEEIWLDVERVDKLISSEGQGPGYQKTTRKLFWDDETAAVDAHPTRTQVEKRIEDPQDEDTFVPLNVIDKLKTQRGQGPGYLKSTKKYVNDRETNTAREVSIRRVYHWDTETDPSEDGGLNYVRVAGTENRSQYLDVAVVEKLISTQGQGPGFKKRTLKLNTDPIKEFSEPSPDDVDMTKVVYLDPWQNIVNVQWSAIEFVTLKISLDHLWEFTPEYVLTGESCTPSLGFTSDEHSVHSLIHFDIDDDDVGPPQSVSLYQNGEFTDGGGTTEITGLDYPFPKPVDIAPWLFVGATSFGIEVEQFRIEWEAAEGDIILDRNGDPVEAFPGFPFRRSDEAVLKAHGIAFTSGPQCWQRFGGPGGVVPLTIAFTEPHGANEYPSEIPGAEETISVSSVVVEYDGKTFHGIGHFADGGNLSIICEKVTTP